MTSSGTAPGAAARAGDLCRELLEEVYLALRRPPDGIDARAATARLGDALSTLARLRESAPADAAHLGLLDDAIRDIEGVAEVLAPDGDDEAALRLVREVRGAAEALRASRPAALDEVVAAQSRRDVAPQAPPEAPPFRASAGVPGLYRIAHRPFAALLELPKDHEEPAGGEIEASAPQPDERAPDAGWDEGEDLTGARRMARSCLEDIATLGNLRRPRDRDPWSGDVPAIEARLLQRLDALFALAGQGLDVVLEAQHYVAETPAPEPDRAFARAFVLGCVEGEAAVQAAALALRQSPAETLDRQCDALSLASSPAIARAMRRLLGDPSPALVRLALDVLRLRGEVVFADAAIFAEHPDRGVRRAAARALGWVPETALALPVLLEMTDAGEEEQVVAVAAESLLTLDLPAGLELVRARLKEELESPGSVAPAVRLNLLELLALAGDASDLGLLLEAFWAEPHGRAAAALGWLGHIDAVDSLLKALEAGASAGGAAPAGDHQIAIAEALHRITGLGRPVDEENVAAAPEEGGDTDSPPLLCDPARWRAAWDAHRRDLGGGARGRFGEPFTPLAALDELEARGSRPSDRALAALEVALATGGAARVRVEGWIAVQRSDIAKARSIVHAGQRLPGAWLPSGRPAPR